MKNYQNKALIVFDLDGTLTPSKQPVNDATAMLLCSLLAKKQVAVISGGKFERFRGQLLEHLSCSEYFERLALFPVNAAEMYRFHDDKWQVVYRHLLTDEEKMRIQRVLGIAMERIKLHHPHASHGEIVEDRGAQITFSALGQRASLAEKEAWNREHNQMRTALAEELREQLPDFAVSVGGLTSIDITRAGMDKAYGIGQICRNMGVSIGEMLFVGDAIYPGGNDYAATETGVDYVRVKSPQDTKKVIKELLTPPSS